MPLFVTGTRNYLLSQYLIPKEIAHSDINRSHVSVYLPSCTAANKGQYLSSYQHERWPSCMAASQRHW